MHWQMGSDHGPPTHGHPFDETKQNGKQSHGACSCISGRKEADMLFVHRQVFFSERCFRFLMMFMSINRQDSC